MSTHKRWDIVLECPRHSHPGCGCLCVPHVDRLDQAGNLKHLESSKDLKRYSVI